MRGVTITGVFCLWMALSTGVHIELIPPHPQINQSVLLSVDQISGSIRSFAWFKGENTRSQNQILAYNSRTTPPESPGPMYSPRISCFPNASLKISELNIEDQGNYTLQVQQEAHVRGTVQLLLYAIVTKPVIRTTTITPIVNEEVHLTCDTMNSQKILWGRSGKIFPPGVIQSSDNRTITFPSIKPEDTGLYWCEAENPVSKKTSDLYTMTVYCVCGSTTSDLNAAEISGVIIGTLLGLALLAGGIFLLLYVKRHKLPVREEPRDMEEYLQVFEQMVEQEKLPKDQWADVVAPFLTREPQKTYCDQCEQEAKDYFTLRGKTRHFLV
ncbi:LOW QUALITY PROTEIN: cell adhesion molecule CEACAM7-like [Leptodactylus fuscus]|uniref:LOW QUALITY PROTEIN: cell adhesion molecule CEACAM7-like n=1 Tax=Leptodactylus fuscus TaxID=238119 RepID=UPI003F4ED0A1